MGLQKITYLLLAYFMFGYKTMYCQSEKSGSLLQKGNMYTGLTFSFDVSNTQNEQQTFTTIQDRKRNEFSINVNNGYFLKEAWALGAQISYGRTKRIGTDINIRNIPEDISMIEESWGLYASTKNYLLLGKSQRFYLYNLVILGGRIDNALTESVSQGVYINRCVRRG